MGASRAVNRWPVVCPWHQGLFSVRCTRLRGQQPGCSAPGRVRGGWSAQTYVRGIFYQPVWYYLGLAPPARGPFARELKGPGSPPGFRLPVGEARAAGARAGGGGANVGVAAPAGGEGDAGGDARADGAAASGRAGGTCLSSAAFHRPAAPAALPRPRLQSKDKHMKNT